MSRRTILRLAVATVLLLTGCGPEVDVDEREAALELADDLFQAEWSVPQDHGVRLNFRAFHEGGDGAIARVSLSEIRYTRGSSGGALIVSYFVFENRWQALSSFIDSRMALEEVNEARLLAGEPPDVILSDRDDLMEVCYRYLSDGECVARSGNVVIHVLSRLPSFGGDGFHESSWLGLARDHLRNVRARRVAMGSSIPTVPPPDPFDR